MGIDIPEVYTDDIYKRFEEQVSCRFTPTNEKTVLIYDSKQNTVTIIPYRDSEQYKRDMLLRKGVKVIDLYTELPPSHT